MAVGFVQLPYLSSGLSSQPTCQALSYCGTSDAHSPPEAPSTTLELPPLLEQTERAMGCIPNDGSILRHWPELLQSLGGLVHTVLQTGKVHPTSKRLIVITSSRTQRCTYCTARSKYGANQLGVDAKKISAVFEFETSPLFTDAERAVLRVALHVALKPNAVTDEDFEALKAHFSGCEIVEIVADLSLYGFLNRWNGTLNMELEALPAAYVASLPD